ncbi:hypothetical protein BDP81DRAFT_191875 [Colletotrichum phormii]|uniref:Uncharacterized protein n=1 Tax=Colletotrichum phormii TaxID=359342 RepID=A0AAJ0EH38_9PEZI|nr:uncharacterized protein BDP81DRAFT_191875 [Colletotrichum phormii]KAK1638813.1 hypothetical protein BDP81DRAFT_191875 [Colletotrichum phormii]
MSSNDSDSDASITSVRSCIVVEVLPEDLTAACNTDCTPERCDAATVRPCEPPATEHGLPGSFRPFNVPATRRTTRKGCLDCNVPLCIDRDCWYLWHTQNL